METNIFFIGIGVGILWLFILYIAILKVKFKRLEEKMVKNICEILPKLDKANRTGENKMEGDMVKLGKFVRNEITKAKQEILEKLEEIIESIDSMEGEEYDESEEDFSEEEESLDGLEEEAPDELDELYQENTETLKVPEYNGKRKIKSTPPPAALAKPKKRGLFGKKKLTNQKDIDEGDY